MIRMNDIYFKVDSKIVERGYNLVDVTRKLELVDEELKNYAIEKINELQPNPVILENNNESTTVYDLVTILGELIPKKDHFDTLRHFTHYVLNIAGDIQSFCIPWAADDTSVLGSPRADIDENGLWTELNSHKDEDLVKTFHFAYDILQNQMVKNKTPKIG